MATDLVPSDCQKIPGSQAGGVADQDPRGQQDLVLAGARAALHRLRRRQPLGDLLMTQGRGVRLGHLDTPQWANYTLVHVAFLSCEAEERPQHPTMVVDGGGSEMTGRIVKVGVDLRRTKVAGLPRQAAAQDSELLQVAGATSDPTPVFLGQLADSHATYSQRAGEYPPVSQSSSAPQIRYNRTRGQLAQLSRSRLYGLLLWALTRRWPIVRAGWLTLLVVGLFLHRLEGVLGLLVLGHLGSALTDACAPWKGRRDRHRPTDGAFSTEVNR